MPTIYQQVLQEKFATLHPTLRHFFGLEGVGRAAGRLRVTRAPGRLRNLVAAGLGIPPAGEYDMQLEVTPRGERQLWVRRFGRHALTTGQRAHRGLLVEASGPASIGFDLVAQDGALIFKPRRAWALGVPLPLWLAPHIEAENLPHEAGGWRVVVRFGVPLLGPVAAYEGVVTAEGGLTPAGTTS
jgi:hypothetical protein